jgi:hypothetical protein
VPSGLPRNLEAAIQRYGSATYKAPVATVLDPNGKLSITLTYGKFSWFYIYYYCYLQFNDIKALVAYFVISSYCDNFEFKNSL